MSKLILVADIRCATNKKRGMRRVPRCEAPRARSPQR